MVFAYNQVIGLIVVTVLRKNFPGESLVPVIGGFACNCPVPEAWTTEAMPFSYFRDHYVHRFITMRPISTTATTITTTTITSTTTTTTNATSTTYSCDLVIHIRVLCDNYEVPVYIGY